MTSPSPSRSWLGGALAGARRPIELALISAAARLPGFVIPLAIAALFGAGASTDAFFIVYSAALLIGGTLGQAIEVAIVPFVTRELSDRGGAPRRLLTGTARRAAMVAAGLWGIAAPVLVLTQRRAHGSQIALYAACFAALVISWPAASVYSGALVSQWKIARATASNVWRGVGALVGVVLAPAGAGLWAVAAGLGAGEGGRWLYLRREALRGLAESAEAKAPPVRAVERAAGAQAVGAAAQGTAPLAERLLAVALGAGGVSHLEYATRLLAIPTVLFEGALAPLLLARWSRDIVALGREPPRGEVLRLIARGMLLAVACAAVLALAAPLVVSSLLGHGRFSASDVAAVASLLRFLTVGFVATMGALLLERLYLAGRRNRTLAGLAFGRVGIRVASAWLFLPRLGLGAFAVGYALADWAYLLALVGLLRVGAARPGLASAKRAPGIA
jgi:putative peptidoglycan lipid II flippase